MRAVTNFFEQEKNGPTQAELMQAAVDNPPPGFRTTNVIHDSVLYEPIEVGATFSAAEFWRNVSEQLVIPEEILFRPIDIVEEMKPKKLSLNQILQELGQGEQGRE